MLLIENILQKVMAPIVEVQAHSIRLGINRASTKWLPLLAGATGLVTLLIATARYGIGLSSDSISYLSVARSLLSNHGYYQFQGEPLLVFPPLYPTVLALIGHGEWDLYGVARWLNAICFGVIVWLATRWLLLRSQSLLLATTGALAILLSLPLLQVFVYAWSEPLFILLTLLALVQMQSPFFSSRYGPVLLAGSITALAVLTRYAGIALVIAGCVVLLLGEHQSLNQKIRRLAVFLFISLLLLMGWLMRNYWVSGSLTGERVPSSTSFRQSLYLTVDIVTSWFMPVHLPIELRVILSSLLVFAIIAMTYGHYGILKSLNSSYLGPILPMGLFVAVYTGFLLFVVSRTALSPIDERYLSPIYVPLVLCGGYLLGRIACDSANYQHRRAVKLVVLAILALGLMDVGFKGMQAIRYYWNEGAGGFHTVRWMSSALMTYLRGHDLSGSVYTNEPEAVYALTGKVFLGSPRQYSYGSEQPTDDVAKFEEILDTQGQVYLVLFVGGWWKGYLFDIDFYQSHYCVEEVFTAEDGAIYLVKPDKLSSHNAIERTPRTEAARAGCQAQ